MAAPLRNTATRRWGILVLLTVLGAVAGLAYALIRPPEYTAKAYLAVVAENPGDSSAASYAQAYSRIASQGDALQTAADASGGSASVQDLRHSVLAAASPDAPVIELTGTANSAQRAADLVNLMANGLAKTVNGHTGDTRVRVVPLSAAVPPADPTSPQLPLSIAVGAAAGLLLGGLAFLGRSEKRSPDRSGVPQTAETVLVDPAGTVEPSTDGNVIQRLTSWRAKTPVKVVTSIVPIDEPPSPHGDDIEVKVGQDVEPASVVDVAPAVPRKRAGKASDDVMGDGERMSDGNDGKPKASTPRPRQRGRVASGSSPRRDGAD